MDSNSFPPVQQRLMEFIKSRFRTRQDQYSVQKLIGDASARQYFRLTLEDKASFVLAAYPAPFEMESFTYRQVYDLFKQVALPVARMFDIDPGLAIVLQEDLGDESLQSRLRGAGAGDRRRWLVPAIDLLIKIQTDAARACRSDTEAARLAFDEEKLAWELAFFRRYYGEYRKLPLAEREELVEESVRLARELAAYPRFLCHRDYHIRNLMVKDKRIYIIDFQDARQGPASYDLVSLLKDSIHLGAEEVTWFTRYYLDRSCALGSPALLDDATFERQFDLMCVQRLLKALGTYGYQITQRGNFIYEQYVAGSLARALRALQSVPEFPYIQSLVTSELTNIGASA
jgi:aminoglycoside/choline kinase family phosphotransferase